MTCTTLVDYHLEPFLVWLLRLEPSPSARRTKVVMSFALYQLSSETYVGLYLNLHWVSFISGSNTTVNVKAWSSMWTRKLDFVRLYVITVASATLRMCDWKVGVGLSSTSLSGSQIRQQAA
eukprot:scpid16390/ scgid16109/ 